MSVYLVLLHYPVYNKNGQIISTSIVIHDIHDMSRCAKTFDIKKFYIVQPFSEEREIVHRIKRFWKERGKRYNPNRAESIEIAFVKESLEEVLNEIRENEGKSPILIGTSAKQRGKSISYSLLSERMNKEDSPFILVFGTGWGIVKEIEDKFDYFLPPIRGKSDFNHLSVRSAAAIIMDRLLGRK